MPQCERCRNGLGMQLGTYAVRHPDGTCHAVRLCRFCAQRTPRRGLSLWTLGREILGAIGRKPAKYQGPSLAHLLQD